MTKVPLQIHIGKGLEAAGESFIEAWEKAEKGVVEPERHVSFETYEGFARVATPRRVELMKALRRSGPLSVRALSIMLKRDYKSVHGDVAKLLDIGLVDRTDAGLVEVTWDEVTAKLSLLAA